MLCTEPHRKSAPAGEATCFHSSTSDPGMPPISFLHPIYDCTGAMSTSMEATTGVQAYALTLDTVKLGDSD